MDTIASYLKVIASRILLAHDLPETVVEVLKEFERLFKDDSNFIDFDKWGTAEKGLKIRAFSFSGKGLAEIERLKKESKTFAHLYEVGTAGIHDEKYHLPYFLTQYISVIGNTHDFVMLEIQRDKKNKPDKIEMLLKLEKKIKSIENLSNAVNLRQFYEKTVPFKKYTQEEAKKSKNDILAMIRTLMGKFEAVVKLSPEEKKYFHSDRS